MRILLIFVLLLLMVGRAEPAGHFAPQAFLAGHCWKGTFPDGKRTDEHCYEWVYAGQFLRDRHTHPDATAEVTRRRCNGQRHFIRVFTETTMPDPAQALATQLANIEKRTGKTLQQLDEMLRKSGLAKHGELRDFLKRELGMGHGDANTLVHHVLRSDFPGGASGEVPIDDIVAGIYAGPKAALRPIHDKVMKEIAQFGEFEIAPKKTYLSLRRRKQFAMIGPATNTRIEVGLNLKGVTATGRLLAMPPQGMCSHVVKLTSVAEANAELTAWIRAAFDAAA